MYESRRQPMLSKKHFRRRMLHHTVIALVLMFISLAIGIAGYSMFEHLAFLDALLNSAMLLGGMGPVNNPVTPAGKIFASVYALYAGLMFIATAALLITPVLHRLMHKFHMDEK